MLSRVLRLDAGAAATPMNWLEVAKPVPPERQSIQYIPAAPPPRSKAQVEAETAAQATAEAQIEHRVREAREMGRREGEIAGRQAAGAEVQPVLLALGAAIREIAELKPRLRKEAEGDLVRLALAIARRVVNRELSVDPEAITGLIAMGLEKLRLNEVTRVRVHPQHQAALKEYLGRTGAMHVEVNVNAAQERGTAVIETIRGNLDVSAETQLAEIERGLTDRLRR
jgi:flagellar assembly protein FliH